MPLYIDPEWEYRETDPEIEEAMGQQSVFSLYERAENRGFRVGKPNGFMGKLGPEKAPRVRDESHSARQRRKAREAAAVRHALRDAARRMLEIDRAVRRAMRPVRRLERRKLLARKFRREKREHVAAQRKKWTRAIRVREGLRVRLTAPILLVCQACGLAFAADRKARKCCSDFCRLAWLHKNRRRRQNGQLSPTGMP